MTDRLCDICSLPALTSPCSERCQVLKPLKKRIEAQGEYWDRTTLKAVSELKKGTTICPGQLAFSLLSPEERGVKNERDALALLRSRYRALREKGLIRFFQKGVCVPIAKWPRGAFRIAK